MPNQKIATERVYRDLPDGRTVLVAVPGDPIPDVGEEPAGYREAIDTRAATADAALATGSELPPAAQLEQEQQELRARAPRTLDDDVPYAPPLPKPGEEGADEAMAAAAEKARSSGDVEDKAQKRSRKQSSRSRAAKDAGSSDGDSGSSGDSSGS